MPGLNENQLVAWLVVFLLQLQIVHGISNNAMDSIFKFLKAISKILSNGERSLSLQHFFQYFPSSLYVAMSFIKFSNSLFKEYPVCPSCKCVYSVIDECIETCGTIRQPKKCVNKVGHQRCGSDVVLCNNTGSGTLIFKPIQAFCYGSIGNWLVSKVSRTPSFLQDCELWKARSPVNSSQYWDVYDGSIWVDMQPFLKNPYHLALQLNIDWFQPYKHLSYSVGAMYITVLNLPSKERYKLKNVFLAGVIPGPDEPKHDINDFLRPLVSELLDLWHHGIAVSLLDGSSITIKCALFCLACDIPAGRKVAGFIGHSGRLGCSKCLKEFKPIQSARGKLNYSGFDRNNWQKRTESHHRECVNRILSIKMKTEREKKEKELGCRYSALLDLPYFDPVRMTIIDPMHNLFLGTAKRFMTVLTDDMITKEDIVVIQDTVSSFKVPRGVGRILWKIKSNFSGLTAEQWMNWTIIYSIAALKGKISDEVLECWRHFVLGCRCILKFNPTKRDVDLADALFLRFCTKFESIFGGERMTPNMHLHCHLKECIVDFGPLRNFWLFSFERYNGILENQKTNNANIEPQLMKQVIRVKKLVGLLPPALELLARLF